MNHLIINVSDEETQRKPPFSAYDDKLRKALTEQTEHVAIYLHPSLGCGIDLLEWLETWTEKFQKAAKQFHIVPGNVNQLECLEVSHPDQGLRYVASADDLEAFLSTLSPPPPVRPSVPVQAPAQISEAVEKRPAISEENEPESAQKPAVSMEVGTRVIISGEYICSGCNTPRMWLKGDISTECANPECTNSDAGWEMTYELF